MGTINKDIRALSAHVLARSTEFASWIQGVLPTILCDVGNYSNDAFLLRSFVSLRTDNQGNELAVNVDITTKSTGKTGSTFSIESDLSMDDGTVVATGPSANLDTSSPGFDEAIASWCKEFDAFLHASEADVINVLRDMISKDSEVRPRSSAL